MTSQNCVCGTACEVIYAMWWGRYLYCEQQETSAFPALCIYVYIFIHIYIYVCECCNINPVKQKFSSGLCPVSSSETEHVYAAYPSVTDEEHRCLKIVTFFYWVNLL